MATTCFNVSSHGDAHVKIPCHGNYFFRLVVGGSTLWPSEKNPFLVSLSIMWLWGCCMINWPSTLHTFTTTEKPNHSQLCSQNDTRPLRGYPSFPTFLSHFTSTTCFLSNTRLMGKDHRSFVVHYTGVPDIVNVHSPLLLSIPRTICARVKRVGLCHPKVTTNSSCISLAEPPCTWDDLNFVNLSPYR